jgi:hypothetical protein
MGFGRGSGSRVLNLVEGAWVKESEAKTVVGYGAGTQQEEKHERQASVWLALPADSPAVLVARVSNRARGEILGSVPRPGRTLEKKGGRTEAATWVRSPCKKKKKAAAAPVVSAALALNPRPGESSEQRAGGWGDGEGNRERAHLLYLLLSH